MNLGYDPLWVSIFFRQTGDGLKATWADTGRFLKILCETAKNIPRNYDFLAPARSLVQLTFGNATMIIASAEGALSVSAQAHKVAVNAARISIAWVQRTIVTQRGSVLN
jgi:hypothetical protein